MSLEQVRRPRSASQWGMVSPVRHGMKINSSLQMICPRKPYIVHVLAFEDRVWSHACVCWLEQSRSFMPQVKWKRKVDNSFHIR
jgi:hypothetical protein